MIWIGLVNSHRDPHHKAQPKKYKNIARGEPKVDFYIILSKPISYLQNSLLITEESNCHLLYISSWLLPLSLLCRKPKLIRSILGHGTNLIGSLINSIDDLVSMSSIVKIFCILQNFYIFFDNVSTFVYYLFSLAIRLLYIFIVDNTNKTKIQEDTIY